MSGFLPTTGGLSYRERFLASHGHRYDRGHFMSHRQAGGLDINLFPQRADINQGHSALGKQYRAMERDAVTHRNTFVFSRPLYDDKSWGAHPAAPSAIATGASGSSTGDYLLGNRFTSTWLRPSSRPAPGSRSA